LTEGLEELLGQKVVVDLRSAFVALGQKVVVVRK
jgi:hypothetical protein